MAAETNVDDLRLETSQGKRKEESNSQATELSEVGHVSTVSVNDSDREDETSAGGSREFCIKMSTIPRKKANGILKNGRGALLTFGPAKTTHSNNNNVKDEGAASQLDDSDDQTMQSAKFGPDVDLDNTRLVSNGDADCGLILPTKTLPEKKVKKTSTAAKDRNLKVSWSESVVYPSESSSDIENVCEDNPSNEENGESSEHRSGYTDDHEYEIEQVVSRVGAANHEKQTDAGATHKCCIMLAVILLVFAIIGLIVLGVMYFLRLSDNRNDNDPSKLRSKLNLKSPPGGSNELFRGASRSASLYLVTDGDMMHWQRPSNTAQFLWHRGSPLLIYSLGPNGLKRSLLGDPIESEGALFSVSLSPDSWHAARVFDKDTYALLSVLPSAGDMINWTEGNQFKLEEEHPSLGNVIQAFIRT